MMAPTDRNIDIEFDEETHSYFIVWQPLFASSGRTEREALEDLRAAAHFGIDTMIDLKLGKVKQH
jgi:hypothetical protein